jgi:acetyltransferase-like isoleucine patch superfamily enzyme
MEDPDKINQQEVSDYYGYKGILGKLRFYGRFLNSWILQNLAKIVPHHRLAVMLQRMRGVKIGQHVYIGPGVNIDDVYPHLVVIEDYVSIGMNSMIFAHSNPTCSLEIKQKYYPRKTATTTIKKGAWIPPGCIVLAGVTIGENSIVGAGSVVIRDVEPYTIAAGNPAQFVAKLKQPASSQNDKRTDR